MKKVISLLIFLALMLTSIYGVCSQPIRSEGMPQSDESGEYYAVIAGCSDYQLTRYNLPKFPFPPLSEKKMKYVYDALLEDDNWDEGNIVLLLNEDASRQGIIDALEQMATRVSSDDIFLFSWSGHGSRCDDIDGDEALLSPSDRWDEVICPWDITREGDNVITDDELDALFDCINCSGMFLLFESCFSGGLVDTEVGAEWCLADIDGPDRVIVTSTPDGYVGRVSFVVGWGLMKAFSLALSGWAIDGDEDGMISAEEAFQSARWIYALESSFFWLTLGALNLYQMMQSESENPLLNAILCTGWQYYLLQGVMYLTLKAGMRNWACMSDGFDGNLPLVGV